MLGPCIICNIILLYFIFWQIPRLDDHLQETTHSKTLTVDGIPAVVIDLRDRLTHANGRRYLLLVHEDNLFLMKSVFGETAELEAAFDHLVQGLQFAREAR